MKEKRTVQNIMMFVLFMTSRTMYGQSHEDLWLRLTLSKPITDKVIIDMEIQHRRQNGFNNKNMFDQNLMNSFRLWSHYRFNNKLKLSLSPFAYFSQYKIIQEKNDNLVLPSREIRMTVVLEMQQSWSEKLYFINRIAAEYRMLYQQIPITRIRTRFGIRYDATTKIKLHLTSEIFSNLSGINLVNHFFDQNRIQLGILLNPIKNINIEAAYMIAQRLPLHNNNPIFEKNVLLNIGYVFN